MIVFKRKNKLNSVSLVINITCDICFASGFRLTVNNQQRFLKEQKNVDEI